MGSSSSDNTSRSSSFCLLAKEVSMGTAQPMAMEITVRVTFSTIGRTATSRVMEALRTSFTRHSPTFMSTSNGFTSSVSSKPRVTRFDSRAWLANTRPPTKPIATSWIATSMLLYASCGVMSDASATGCRGREVTAISSSWHSSRFVFERCAEQESGMITLIGCSDTSSENPRFFMMVEATLASPLRSAVTRLYAFSS